MYWKTHGLLKTPMFEAISLTVSHRTSVDDDDDDGGQRANLTTCVCRLVVADLSAVLPVHAKAVSLTPGQST